MVFTTSLCVKVHLYDYNNTIFTTFNINTSYFAVSRRSGTLQSGSSLKTTLEIDRIIANLLYLCISEISQCMSLTKFIANIAKLSPSTIWRLRHFVHFHNFVKLNPDFEDIPDLWTYVIRASIENKNNARWALMADKYAVREVVKNTIGEKYLIPLLGKWDKGEDIDFDTLPDSFILKTNNGCGTNIFVHDKSKIDKPAIIAQLNKALQYPYPELSGQLHYSLIKPCIIAEKLMIQDGGRSSLTDYKIHCVNGEPVIIYTFSDRDELTHFDFNLNSYTPAWQEIPPFTSPEEIRNNKPAANKPACLDEMLELARKLSAGEEYVRVDFYITDGKIYFGEMTYTPDTRIHPAFKSYRKVMGYILDRIKATRRK